MASATPSILPSTAWWVKCGWNQAAQRPRWQGGRLEPAELAVLLGEAPPPSEPEPIPEPPPEASPHAAPEPAAGRESSAAHSAEPAAEPLPESVPPSEPAPEPAPQPTEPEDHETPPEAEAASGVMPEERSGTEMESEPGTAAGTEAPAPPPMAPEPDRPSRTGNAPAESDGLRPPQNRICPNRHAEAAPPNLPSPRPPSPEPALPRSPTSCRRRHRSPSSVAAARIPSPARPAAAAAPVADPVSGDGRRIVGLGFGPTAAPLLSAPAGGGLLHLVRDPQEGGAASWLAGQWPMASAVVAVGACGLVTRLIAPLITDKDSDPAVVVVDPDGRFVVPLLGGHAAGADRLSQEIAALVEGQAVLTGAGAARVGWHSTPSAWPGAGVGAAATGAP